MTASAEGDRQELRQMRVSLAQKSRETALKYWSRLSPALPAEVGDPKARRERVFGERSVKEMAVRVVILREDLPLAVPASLYHFL
jgi:hypothetical protein